MLARRWSVSRLVAEGRLKPAEFDGFVRDTVNFLDYVGRPSQVAAPSASACGWCCSCWCSPLFAWALKKEYWKDVH